MHGPRELHPPHAAEQVELLLRLAADTGARRGELDRAVCVDSIIADYLATGVLPARQPGNKADVICDPLPLPVPETAAAVAASSGSSRAAAHAVLTCGTALAG